MGCHKEMKIKPVTTERCNKMIDEFEKNISDMLKMHAKYNKEERLNLIAEIKKYPNHVWIVTQNGLIHMALF